MRLSELFPAREIPSAVADARVSRVDIDSRQVGEGSVFFALPGGTVDGATFIDEALRAGATYVVAQEGAVSDHERVLQLPTNELWAELANASYRIVGDPQRELDMVGVTGTNGKTSVATFVTSLLRYLGRDAATIGTLTHVRTTPEAPELARTMRAYLSEWQPEPVHPAVALEVSSHALDQHRVDGLVFDVAVFTNLSHDHLDYHETMDRYLAAKATLFTPERSRHAVVWNDGEWSEKLLSMATTAATVLEPDSLGVVEASIGRLKFQWRGHVIESRLTGRYNAVNLALALEACAQLGADVDKLVVAASRVEPVPGRCELVSSPTRTVLVDFAHTPDGLATVLRDVRSMHAGRIITVFGCGGDRDTAKRSVMGHIAGDLSDVSIVTNDNPRSEDPSAIAAQVVSGMPSGATYQVILDRRDAIREALALAGAEDIVIVAGKGHVKTQQIGATVIDFDDVAVARELVEEMSC